MFAPKTRTVSSFAFLLFVCLACILVFSPMLHGQGQLPTAPKDPTSYRDVVKKVLPAVVSIEHNGKPIAATKQSAPRRQPWFDNSQIPEEFRRFFEDFQFPFNMPSLPQRSFGSGFIVDSSGVIVTNYHVVKGADQVTVKLADGRSFPSKEIKTDPRTDLAVVRIEAKGSLPALQFDDSAAMEIGDRVLAVGAPFGFTGSVTAGIISGKGRNPNSSIYEEYLQTDAAINPGNSGGPLVNLEGKVIGVNTAIKSNSGGSQGVGLAIPSNVARNIMDKLLKEGSVKRGYLGVQVRTLEPDVAARLGVEKNAGVVVARVMEGSPAAKVGIQPGDVITAVNGNPIHDPTELLRQVVKMTPKQSAKIAVIRDGKSMEVQATVDDQPADLGQVHALPTPAPGAEPNDLRLEKIGIELADLTSTLTQRFGHADRASGAIVTRVAPGSLAALANMEAGTLITKVDSTKVQSATEAKTALEKASLERGILLQVQHPKDGGTGYVMLKAKVNH